MNKVIIAAGVVAVFLAAGWYFMSSRSAAPELEPSTTASDTPLAPPAKQDASAFGSLKDAMGLNKKLSCTYTDGANAGATSTVFVDGKKMKFVSAINGTVMYGLFDGDTQYTWFDNEGKRGFKMDAACLAEMKQTVKNAPAGSASPVQDYEALSAIANVQCAPAASEDFSVPADITFTDQCAMLRESMRTPEQMQR